MIGYVHAPYVETYSLLAQASGFDSVLLVNGVEGGIIPPLTKPVPTHWRDFLGAAAYTDRVVPPPSDASPGRGSRFDSSGGTARAASDEALAALQGEPGPFANALVHGAALCLWRLGHAPSREEGAAAACAALASGDAYRRLIALSRNHHSLSIE